jgi:hypothetical protein
MNRAPSNKGEGRTERITWFIQQRQEGYAGSDLAYNCLNFIHYLLFWLLPDTVLKKKIKPLAAGQDKKTPHHPVVTPL